MKQIAVAAPTASVGDRSLTETFDIRSVCEATPARRRHSTAFPLLGLGIISGDTLSGIQHAVMIPSMLLVMLRRRRELAH